MLNFLDWLRGRSTDGKTAAELYGSIVTQARLPVFYTRYGIQDVAEKRYEMIVLHIVLVLERLRASGEDGGVIGQALTETFVRDLDGSMREMAVGDTKVPAKVKKAAGGLLDRDILYRQAFDGMFDSTVDSIGGLSASEAPIGTTVAEGLIDDDAMTVDNLVDELMFDGEGNARAKALAKYVVSTRALLKGWTLCDHVEAVAFPDPETFIEGAV